MALFNGGGGQGSFGQNGGGAGGGFGGGQFSVPLIPACDIRQWHAVILPRPCRSAQANGHLSVRCQSMPRQFRTFPIDLIDRRTLVSMAVPNGAGDRLVGGWIAALCASAFLICCGLELQYFIFGKMAMARVVSQKVSTVHPKRGPPYDVLDVTYSFNADGWRQGEARFELGHQFGSGNSFPVQYVPGFRYLSRKQGDYSLIVTMVFTAAFAVVGCITMVANPARP